MQVVKSRLHRHFRELAATDMERKIHYFSPFSHTSYICESTVIVKKFHIELLTDLHILSPSKYDKFALGMPSVCKYCDVYYCC
jgi:hypothetical protein